MFCKINNKIRQLNIIIVIFNLTEKVVKKNKKQNNSRVEKISGYAMVLNLKNTISGRIKSTLGEKRITIH